MRKITLKNIRDAFPNYTTYEQQSHKQLFVCSGYIGPDTANNHNKILVSYLTIVGYYDAVLCTWILTKERYSVTTSKQITQFARGRSVTWVNTLSEGL